LREHCSPDEQRRMVELVVLIVSRIFPDPEDGKTWPRCQRYLHQALTCAVSIEQWNIASQAAAHLLSRVATYAWKHTRFRLAERLLKQLLTVLTQLEREDTIGECLNNLAVLYQYQ